MRIDVVPAMVAGHRRFCWAGPRCVSSGTGLQPARYIRWCRVQELSSPRFLRYANIEKFGLAFGVTMRRLCLDDLPDEVLIRIMSLLAWSRDLNPSSLVSKRWAQLVRLVTHYSLESSSRDVEQGLIRWFGHNDLRQLSIRFQQSCTRWLHQIGKGLHSVTIYGGPQHKFEDFWSNISACQELRCLHVHVTQLGSTLGNATLPSPLLPNLLFLSFHRPINVTVLQQLLEICPSLLVVRMNTIVVSSPGTYVLKSRSLDSCQSEFCEGDGRDNFMLALDTPKLRWMFFVVPRIQLQPTTCNVEWIRVRESMRHIQGLRYSRLKKIIFLNPFSSPAQVMHKVALCRTLSLKKFYFCIFDDGISPCSIDLVALLEPFQGLEEFIVSFISIKQLYVANWSSMEKPLTVRVEFVHTKHVWERNGLELEFIRELVERSSGTKVELKCVYWTNKDASPQIPALLEEFAREHPGRVKLQPLQWVPRSDCGMLWRSWQESVESEAPYAAIDHWCRGMHESHSHIPCGWQ